MRSSRNNNYYSISFLSSRSFFSPPQIHKYTPKKKKKTRKQQLKKAKKEKKERSVCGIENFFHLRLAQVHNVCLIGASSLPNQKKKSYSASVPCRAFTTCRRTVDSCRLSIPQQSSLPEVPSLRQTRFQTWNPLVEPVTRALTSLASHHRPWYLHPPQLRRDQTAEGQNDFLWVITWITHALALIIVTSDIRTIRLKIHHESETRKFKHRPFE